MTCIDFCNNHEYQVKKEKQVIRPCVGNVLRVLCKRDESITYYVVLNCFKTKDLITSISLAQVVSKDGNNLVYGPNTLNLNLTGAGTWFTKDMQTHSDWRWVTTFTM